MSMSTVPRQPASDWSAKFKTIASVKSDGVQAVSKAGAISGGSGTVGVKIGNQSVTVTWGVSDAATCTALVAAINATASLAERCIATDETGGAFLLKGPTSGSYWNNIPVLPIGTGVTINSDVVVTLLGAGTAGVDPTELPFRPRRIHVSTNGDIKFIGLEDVLPVTITVVAGQVYSYMPRVIFSTGTTATGVIAA